jgi:SAM-dependent methyltransferase
MVKNLIENTELFSGKADAYAKARPGYPEEAIEYILSLVPVNAVFADIGAGTGKFTELLARRGFELFAVEPNGDMREQLAKTLEPYPKVTIVEGTAEATTLPDKSVDVITCAQALHWFDLETFRTECRRIGKNNILVIAVYNDLPNNRDFHSKIKLSTDVFFSNPTTKEFPNPIFYNRESWLQFMHTHSHSPMPNDPLYAAYIDEANAIFDGESVDGLLKRDMITRVYSERIKI